MLRSQKENENNLRDLPRQQGSLDGHGYGYTQEDKKLKGDFVHGEI